MLPTFDFIATLAGALGAFDAEHVELALDTSGSDPSGAIAFTSTSSVRKISRWQLRPISRHVAAGRRRRSRCVRAREWWREIGGMANKAQGERAPTSGYRDGKQGQPPWQ
jgi:hypothetical protein